MEKTIQDKKIRRTFSVDRDIYHDFQVLCLKQGMKISAKLQLFMEDELERYKNDNRRSNNPVNIS